MAEPKKNRAVAWGNLALVLAFAWLWLTPVVQFWGAVHGAFRPRGYPPGDLAPSLLWFLAGLAACFLPCALPFAYFQAWEGPRAVRVFERLGVPTFKRFTTNGDRINRWGRRQEAGHRVIRGAASARAWAHLSVGAERNHLVFLLMGVFSAVHAVRIGWPGWAILLTVSNLVFNLYPVLLQRYNRLRIVRVCPGWALPEGDAATR